MQVFILRRSIMLFFISSLAPHYYLELKDKKEGFAYLDSPFWKFLTKTNSCVTFSWFKLFFFVVPLESDIRFHLFPKEFFTDVELFKFQVNETF